MNEVSGFKEKKENKTIQTRKEREREKREREKREREKGRHRWKEEVKKNKSISSKQLKATKQQ